MKIFQLTEFEWWLAGSLEEAKADYVETTGEPVDDDARELTDTELDALRIYENPDEQGVDEPRDTVGKSFREELEERVRHGSAVVGLFAAYDP